MKLPRIFLYLLLALHRQASLRFFGHIILVHGQVLWLRKVLGLSTELGSSDAMAYATSVSQPALSGRLDFAGCADGSGLLASRLLVLRCV